MGSPFAERMHRVQRKRSILDDYGAWKKTWNWARPLPTTHSSVEIEKVRDDLLKFIAAEQALGRSFYLYGASTKGNTLLQYCRLKFSRIIAAAERNPEKWGCRTPLTGIPIRF